MRITFTVDQAAAFRNGINASNSTVVLDIDPASLSQEERDLVAESLCNGHQATKPVWTTNPQYNHEALVLTNPSFEGLKEVLSSVLASRAAHKAMLGKQIENAISSATEEMKKTVERVISIGLNKDGNISEWKQVVRKTATITVPVHVTFAYPNSLPEVAEEVQQHNKRTYEIIKNAEAVLLEEAKAEYQVWKEEQQKAEEKSKAEEAALYAKLPQVLKDKDEAGYASESEIYNALVILAREEEGLPTEWDYFDDLEDLESLTDPEFVTFTKLKNALDLTKFTVTPVQVHNDNTDASWHMLQVTWKVGNLHVESYVSF